MYFIYETRFNKAFIIRKLSKHNAKPRKSHFQVAKRIVYYLKGTIHLKLIYGQGPDESSSTILILSIFIKYSDSNFAEDLKSRKSVIKYCFFLNRAVVL